MRKGLFHVEKQFVFSKLPCDLLKNIMFCGITPYFIIYIKTLCPAAEQIILCCAAEHTSMSL